MTWGDWLALGGTVVVILIGLLLMALVATATSGRR